MTDDHELLRNYTERRSEAAFAELVRRHLGLVFSTAFRITGNVELAKDVAQAVFIQLAQRADSIRVGAATPGWLYRVTCCQARNAVRGEHRRHRREEEAVSAAELRQPDSSSWEEIAPLLDEAMQQLDKIDQDAVIWRFFQGRSFREIGLALAVSDDAAQKRVSRAIERLREVFVKRGLRVGAGGLAALVSANAIQAAPAGLAAGISTAVLAATAGGAGTTVSLLKIFTMTKLHAALGGALLVGAVMAPWMVQHEANLRQENESLRQQLAQIKTAEAGRANPVASPLRPRSSRAAAASATNLTAAGTPFQQVEDFITSHNRQLTSEQIEPYLRQNNRSAESLLAAFQVSRDAAYLREAATNFPKVPAVQFAVLANNIFTDEARKWIDAFKASSPGNALPWYFSALDYFKAQQPNEAIAELTHASQLPISGDYGAQTVQAVEEMFESAGWPALAAKAWAPGTANGSGSYLEALKSLGGEIAQAQQQYASHGEADSAVTMASIGVALANQLRQASAPINQLVGIANEAKILALLDPAQNHAFLGGSVGDAQASLARQKADIQLAMQIRDQVRPTLGESDLADYWEREKMYGEMYAMQWLQSKYPQP